MAVWKTIFRFCLKKNWKFSVWDFSFSFEYYGRCAAASDRILFKEIYSFGSGSLSLLLGAGAAVGISLT